jgi:chemotaxis protein MotB
VADYFWRSLFLAAFLACASGCVVSASRLTEAQTENRVLKEQHQAQLVEIDSLQRTSREKEGRLAQTEEELALVHELASREKSQLAIYEKERDALYEQCRALVGNAKTSPNASQAVQNLAQRYPCLQFDPDTGLSKLNTDVLFDGDAVALRPEADEMIAYVARILQSPEGKNLKIMVVGHTDDKDASRNDGGESASDRFQLSAVRATVVADAFKRNGIDESRMGIAGYGDHQPIVPNDSPENRGKNRRVEIFVMAPNVPVVGWTETIPGAYRR